MANDVLEFPDNVSNTGTFIEFTFFKNTSKKEVLTDVVKKVVSVILDKTGTAVVKCGDKKIKIKKNTEPLSIAKSIFVPTYEIQYRIILYFPIGQNITNEINMQWDETDAGLLGSVINTLKDSGTDSLTETLAKKKQLLTGLGFKTMARAIGGIGEKVATAHDMLSGYKGINPKIDSDFLSFVGLDRRSPEFEFRFVADNAKQQKTINNIISTFELSSYPDDKHQAGIEYPLTVEANVYVANRIIQSFNKMQIQSLKINKNPEGFQFLADGNPVVQDMTISLKEADRFYKSEYLAYQDKNDKYNKNK